MGALDPAGVAEDIGASVEFQGAATERDRRLLLSARSHVRSGIGEGVLESACTSVLTVDVQREDEDSEKVGLKRKVVVLPNGTARLAP